MKHAIDPYVSFLGIPFTPLSDDGEMADWEDHPVWASRKVAGRSLTKRQFMQYDPDTLRLRVLLAGVNDYRQLRKAVGSTGDLVLIPEAVIDAPASRVDHVMGVDYVTFPATTLVQIEKPRPLRDGRALCTLEFEREHEEVE